MKENFEDKSYLDFINPLPSMKCTKLTNDSDSFKNINLQTEMVLFFFFWALNPLFNLFFLKYRNFPFLLIVDLLRLKEDFIRMKGLFK